MVTCIVLVCSASLAYVTQRLLGLLTLRIAIPSSTLDGRQAAIAFVRFFSSEHPRIRFVTVEAPDLIGTANALDKGQAQLAVVRSDAFPRDGRTLAILRKDAAVIIAPGKGDVDDVPALKG